MTKQQIMRDWSNFEIHPERISDEYGEFYLKVYKEKYTYARSALLRVAELELEIEECERMNNFYRLNIKELEEKNKNLMGLCEKSVEYLLEKDEVWAADSILSELRTLKLEPEKV